MVEDGFIILGAKSCPTQGNNRRGIQCPQMYIFDPPVIGLKLMNILKKSFNSTYAIKSTEF